MTRYAGRGRAGDADRGSAVVAPTPAGLAGSQSQLGPEAGRAGHAGVGASAVDEAPGGDPEPAAEPDQVPRA
ncbi:hypothetical protein [Actinophytocola sediminis]